MRRRRLRTALILVTVIVVMFSLTGLTSIIPVSTATFTRPTVYSPAYKGMMIRRLTIREVPQNIIDPNNIDIIQTLSGLNFSKRVWWYPVSVCGKSVYTTVKSDSGEFNIKAMLGLDPNEVLNLSSAIMAGRWITNEDYYACILPDNIADALKVNVGDVISIPSQGIKLRVIGIISTDIANKLNDLDGYPITPLNPDSVSQLLRGYVQEEVWVPLSFREVIIVPSRLLLDLGGYIASLATRCDDFEALRNNVTRLAMSLQLLNFYLCDGRNVLMASPFTAFSLYGWTLVLTPVLIAAFIMASTILGNVRERKRDIETISSLGLSPRGVGFLFIIETLCYALTGYTIGYLGGMLANILLYKFNVLPPEFIVNSSSLATSIALIMGMLAVLIPSIYPAVTASRVVVPSLERKWRIPTKPKGDEWEVPLPFSTKDEKEVLGILRFMEEYLDAHRKESPEVFIVDDVYVRGVERELHAQTRLQPLEAGVVQDVFLRAIWSESESRYTFTLYLKLLAGRREVWISRNREFIDAIRKQLLLWRSLTPSERGSYIEKMLGSDKE
ncbi:MAG: hypothetical protein DRO13_06115 [Thermoprotei archaeon]|nr:MAG: hypothetical protein DRO13_06115 [Thermoprotei archaeon]